MTYYVEDRSFPTLMKARSYAIRLYRAYRDMGIQYFVDIRNSKKEYAKYIIGSVQVNPQGEFVYISYTPRGKSGILNRDGSIKRM